MYTFSVKQNDIPGQRHRQYNHKRKLLVQMAPAIGLVWLFSFYVNYFVHRYADYSQC